MIAQPFDQVALRYNKQRMPFRYVGQHHFNAKKSRPGRKILPGEPDLLGAPPSQNTKQRA
jgi:hypothetical protein